MATEMQGWIRQVAQAGLQAAVAEIDRQGITGRQREVAIRTAGEMVTARIFAELYKSATDREQARREGDRRSGKTGGDTGGFKGGRPSTKPPRIKIIEQYDVCIAQHGDHATARAELAKILARQYKVTVRTARDWLTDAGVLARK